MNAFILLLDRIIYLYVWVLIINAVLSWLVAFNIINTQNRFVYSVLEFTYKLTDPPLNYIRRFLPNLGSIDISPIVLILLIYFVSDLLKDILGY
ncbi:MAG TPA: YggT family protein [Candidatus Pelagibacter sp.]|jgi:YggT family protein|nr:YggT family protein [Candidatus Pelagibacter sp.]